MNHQKEQKENGPKAILNVYPHQSRGKPNCWSIGFSLVNNSDVFGVGIFPSRLVVNVHPALDHTLDFDCLAVHLHVVSIDRGDGHFGGSVSCPPFNQ